MMKKLWFKWREPSEGGGYKIVSIEGWLSIAALTLAILCALFIPLALGTSPIVAVGITSIATFVGLLYLVRLVRQRSDWRG